MIRGQLFKHLSLSGKVVGLMREEHLEIPAEALREALTMSAFLESWGSGVKRMMDSCVGHSLPEPEFCQQGGFVTVCFMKNRLTERLTENQRKIVDLIMADPYVSFDRMAEAVGISRTAIINNTNKLKKRNIIARVGEDNGGRWVLLVEKRD